MTTLAARFRSLHASAAPLVLFNVWDAGSAKTIAESGASAIATSSWAVAAAQGYADGEHLPFDRLVDCARRIAATVSLPVSMDVETGYGASAEAAARSVVTIVQAGVAGINLEDRNPSGDGLVHVEAAAERIAAIRKSLTAHGLDAFINARCDVFFSGGVDDAASQASRLTESVRRAEAYLAAGADGIFLPGLSDLTLVAEAVSAIAAPLNIMVNAPDAIRPLREAGVRRISFGPAPFITAMNGLSSASRAAFAA
ncbi:isocitrate lyase/phosphoenolpyruvate mutase family protein [Alkalicaulis satelles]|uniref:Isocitrate lyase/phosphoenolpyruvate mutase family protein n=1 Tax=Alkalicaulis satelles TaxID=2609175 RepID=A0A5M6ZIS5_9PROT|nr:isocitrate lyase/phosphoenolpyruvate mutase family protein [Alkalicaulis satelles]KAA5804689.1 isocitrate lyase/phosphoenolpyruvate mutase family protein [Alkalicaulis satelles]